MKNDFTQYLALSFPHFPPCHAPSLSRLQTGSVQLDLGLTHFDLFAVVVAAVVGTAGS